MRLVRVKIANGEFINLVYDASTETWKAQLQVPDQTSYLQPDHKYGMVFEAWDEENNYVILDRTDSTFGDDLVVRVRERVTPIITVTSDTYVEQSILYIEFDVTDLGGSTLDLSSIKIKFGSLEFDLNSEYVTVESITNGVHITFAPDFYMPDGTYQLIIEAKDYDENMSIKEVEYSVDTDPCEFITDRTQADVDYVRSLKNKWLDGTITEEEKTIFLQPLKGARNRSDFERILTDMIYMSQMFEIPFNMDELPEIPKESYVQELRDNVKRFRDTLPIHESTPYTPDLPLNTYKKMNDLEQILFDIHENLQYRFKYYCVNNSNAEYGLYMNEEIGILE